MVIVVIGAVVVGFYLLRRTARAVAGPQQMQMVASGKPYNPNRAQYQRMPTRRRSARARRRL